MAKKRHRQPTSRSNFAEPRTGCTESRYETPTDYLHQHDQILSARPRRECSVNISNVVRVG